MYQIYYTLYARKRAVTSKTGTLSAAMAVTRWISKRKGINRSVMNIYIYIIQNNCSDEHPNKNIRSVSDGIWCSPATFRIMTNLSIEKSRCSVVYNTCTFIHLFFSGKLKKEKYKITSAVYEGEGGLVSGPIGGSTFARRGPMR